MIEVLKEEVNLIVDKTDKRPFLPVKIKGKTINALLDSGSQRTIVDNTFINKLNLKYSPPTRNVSLSSASYHTKTVLGGNEDKM